MIVLSKSHFSKSFWVSQSSFSRVMPGLCQHVASLLSACCLHVATSCQHVASMLSACCQHARIIGLCIRAGFLGIVARILPACD